MNIQEQIDELRNSGAVGIGMNRRAADTMEKLLAENAALKEFINDYPLTNNRPTDLAIERCVWIKRGQELVQTTEQVENDG